MAFIKRRFYFFKHIQDHSFKAEENTFESRTDYKGGNKTKISKKKGLGLSDKALALSLKPLALLLNLSCSQILKKKTNKEKDSLPLFSSLTQHQKKLKLQTLFLLPLSPQASFNPLLFLFGTLSNGYPKYQTKRSFLFTFLGAVANPFKILPLFIL